MNKKTIRDVDWANKRALVRVDFNVPQDDSGAITDDTRIRAALPTIRYLLEHGASVVLMSHLGRPKGKVNPKYSLRPVAERLFELLPEASEVRKTEAITGPAAEAAAAALHPGQVLLLENTRFDPREEPNDPAMAQELAKLGDVFVNDAFGAAHRANASTEGVAHHLPAVAGFLLEKELSVLYGALENPNRPFVAILGGAKVSDKIGVISSLMQKADYVLIGGGMANTFAKAHGYEIGDSLVENDKLDVAKDLMGQSNGRLVFPTDAVIADAFSVDANTQTVEIDGVSAGWRILDVGPKTVELFKEYVGKANTIIWNGPMGVFEMEPFAAGTRAIAGAMAEASARGATTIIGGGDSVAAVEQAGVAEQMSHISTGGGASLELLEGKVLPGVAALNDK
ncbi:MAG: phosphoglycerate kinase [Chloroflexaceae bacterium]|jgi:phosphoglycerate kinase|nr:phosphoglycerate kinase [Chloroflexaceae bacterium]